MNDWNEGHLRCWKPRPPSPSLKKRALRGLVQTLDEEPDMAPLPLLQWWAPATALAIAVLTLVSGQLTFSNLASSAASELMTSAALKEPNLVAYLRAAGHTEANAWPITSFEWTNRGGMYTNGLMPQ